MDWFLGILFFGAFQALFLMGVLLLKRIPNRQYLTVLLGIMAFGLLMRVAYSPSLYADWPKMVQFGDLAILLFGPALYFHIQSVVQLKRPKLGKALWVALVPSVLYLVHFALRILPLSNPEFLQADWAGEFNAYYLVLLSTGILWNGFYAWCAYRMIRKAKAKTERKDLTWYTTLTSLIGLTIITWLFSFSLSLVSPDWLNLTNIGYQVVFLLLSSLVLTMSYQLAFGAKRNGPEVPKEKYQKSGLSAERIQFLGEKLTRLMESEQLYLKPDLSLDDLSEELGINKVKVSQVINQYFLLSVPDWINTYRVKTFINKVNSGDYTHLTYLGIAMESGFKTKATFNKVFKKLKKKTPSQYFANRLSPPENAAEDSELVKDHDY